MADLHVFMDGQSIADITRRGKSGGRLYYLQDRGTPLSTSMPVERARHPMSAVRPWLEGLLPDRPQLISQWRRQFGVLDDHPVSLLAHVGEEVAGAAQLVRPDRAEAALSPGHLRPLTDKDVADRLRQSLTVTGAASAGEATRTFSLAGAQAKIMLQRTAEGWAEPYGREPTTHLIKPAIPGLDHQEVTEHMAMAAARSLGLYVADSERAVFEDIDVIVVTRYDRVRQDGQFKRIHQEDLAQALGVAPMRKYQKLGGPTPLQIVEHLRRVTGDFAEIDTRRFLQALIYNWLIVGTDAHAKNYSLVLRGNNARLAPLYDLNSYLAHGGAPSASMSMKIGTTYQASRVTRRDWEDLASDTQVDAEWVMSEIRRQAAAIPLHLAEAGQPFVTAGIGGSLPLRLVDAVTQWTSQALHAVGL